jgi:ABC-type Fe3+ transport system permease subunit
LEKLPDSAGRRWLLMTGFVLLMYVPGALLGGALESDLPFKGGWHWQSLYSSTWEAYLCLGMSISVLYLFRRYANRSGGLAGWLARSAYAAYIIQAPVITAVALLLRELPYHPLLKFAIASAIAVPLCFGAGDLLRRLPYADKVL